VRAAEIESSYIWISMKPFTALLSSRYPEIYSLGLLSLANLTDNPVNRAVLVDEEEEEVVLAHAQWPRLPESNVPGSGDWAAAILSPYPTPRPIPSLKTLSKMKTLTMERPLA